MVELMDRQENRKKRILITAGGTEIAWHMCTVLKEHFAERVEIHIADTNPKELVASASLADRFHRVLPINADDYKTEMLHLLRDEKIEVMIPLIDRDFFVFPSDASELLELGVVSTGPCKKTVELLSDKYEMFCFFRECDIPTPEVYTDGNKLDFDKKYIVKPRKGNGSIGVRLKNGEQLKCSFPDIDEYIVQDVCDGREITAEVFSTPNRTEMFLRERIAVKAGVCTKTRYVVEPEIENIIHKLLKAADVPYATCIQLMFDKDHWAITDCNMRIGAGSALATTYGFQLTRAFLATILDLPIKDEWFHVNRKIKTVLRMYQEIPIYESYL